MQHVDATPTTRTHAGQADIGRERRDGSVDLREGVGNVADEHGAWHEAHPALVESVARTSADPSP